MQVLQLIQQHSVPFHFQLGKEQGCGADGQVFELLNQPNKVIKLSVIYDYPWRDLTCYRHIEEVLNYVMVVQPPAYVSIYEHGYLGTYNRAVINSATLQSFILYYYVMEKLLKISDDERKIFHSILSHEDRGIEKNYSLEKIAEMLQGMNRGLDFDAEKIMIFYHNLRQARVLHNDIHIRNIMKDIGGNFKLVDLDRSGVK
jgi:serine/threonine protein kinase